MNAAPRFSIVSVQAYERDVRLRLPFRFGAATVSGAPQAFVRVRIRCEDGREAEGVAAELMVPKWFDKSPDKIHEDNIDDLREALLAACDAYASEPRPATAFGHSTAHYQPLQDCGTAAGRTALTTGFGGALLDRAVLDAACKASGISFATAVHANAPGITSELAPDLRDFDISAFLRTLVMPDSVAVRHTVGMLDTLLANDLANEVAPGPDDDLPVALDAVIARYGYRHFKLKLRGDPDADIERLSAIAAILDRLPGYAVTLDGNEQFRDVPAIASLVETLRRAVRLRRLSSATLYLEQPLPRDLTLATDVADLAAELPLLIDESDASYAEFPLARKRGYTGVSSKSCKGLYKSIANAARCVMWNSEAGAPRFFMSGEDLTAQAGLALQQDTALAALLGITHVERNGHHYVNGCAGQGAPASEQQALLDAHADLYERAGPNVRLRVRDGRLALGSLAAMGFASGSTPDFASMRALALRAVTT